MGVNVVPSLAGRSRDWIANWELWSLPRGALGYVLAVEAFAVAAVSVPARFQPVAAHDWIRLAILAGCVVAHIELTRRVDLPRIARRESGPLFQYDSVWFTAAVLALPAALADIMVVVWLTWFWVRVWHGRRPLYRGVFSCFTGIAATQAAAAVLAFDPHAYPGAPVAPTALGLAVIAAAVRWLVNFGLVSGAIMLSTPTMRAGQLLARRSPPSTTWSGLRTPRSTRRRATAATKSGTTRRHHRTGRARNPIRYTTLRHPGSSSAEAAIGDRPA